MLESQSAKISWVIALSIRKSAMKFTDALEYQKFRLSSNASPLAIISPAWRSNLLKVLNIHQLSPQGCPRFNLYLLTPPQCILLGRRGLE